MVKSLACKIGSAVEGNFSPFQFVSSKWLQEKVDISEYTPKHTCYGCGIIHYVHGARSYMVVPDLWDWFQDLHTVS